MVKSGLKVQLGAFDCALDGWVNTDITPHLMIARVPGLAALLWRAGVLNDERRRQHAAGIFAKLRYADLTKRLPFSDGSCSAVFSSHVFEHLFLDEARRLILEIGRILAPGGVCRTVVPDLALVVQKFTSADPEPFLHSIYEIGRRSQIKNAHHSGYTGEFLTRLFYEAGFSRAYVTSYRVGACPDLDLLDNRPEISLFVEAVK